MYGEDGNEISFTNKLREDYIQGIFATIEFRLFCLTISYLEA
jgi:hypothetical protein